MLRGATSLHVAMTWEQPGHEDQIAKLESHYSRSEECPMSLKLFVGLLTMALSAGYAISTAAQEVLPFPPKPSGSTAERTMQESITIRSRL